VRAKQLLERNSPTLTIDSSRKSYGELTFTNEFVGRKNNNNMKFDGSSFDGSSFDDSGFNNFLTEDNIFTSKLQNSGKYDEQTEFDETDIKNITNFLADYAKETKIRDSLKSTDSGKVKTGDKNVMPKKEAPQRFTFKMPEVSTVKMVSWESENSWN